MSKMITNRLIFLLRHFIIFAGILIAVSGCSGLKSIKLFIPATWVNMQEIAPNVYVDKDMAETQRQHVLSEITQATENVSIIWGSITADSVIYACSTNKCFKNLGGFTAGGHTLANRILLAPRGLNKEIISHEYSHTELNERIGGFVNSRKIPQWFDEGVAVLVGQDPRHDNNAWKRIKKQKLPYPTTSELYNLKTVSQWNAAFHNYNKGLDLNTIVVVYATAGHEVSKWYTKVGSKGLVSFVGKIKDGNSFTEIYHQNR